MQLTFGSIVIVFCNLSIFICFEYAFWKARDYRCPGLTRKRRLPIMVLVDLDGQFAEFVHNLLDAAVQKLLVPAAISSSGTSARKRTGNEAV
jgi:hypothetical protein